MIIESDYIISNVFSPEKMVLNRGYNQTLFLSKSEFKWEQYKEDIQIVEKMNFDETLKEPIEALRETYEDKNSIFNIILVEDKFAGYLCGGRIGKYVEKYEQEYNETLNNNTYYVESINIHRKFQGLGYGSILFKHFIKQCKNQGIKYITGHFAEGASTNIAKKFGGKILLVNDNYCDTGHRYNYMIIEVK